MSAAIHLILLRHICMEKVKHITPTAGQISIQDFTYELPDERIAKYPLPERDKSKLLIWNSGKITDDRFYNLPDYLPDHSLLVFNNTKVIRARMLFQKDSGARIEVFCLEPAFPVDYQLAFQTTGSCTWLCMVGNLKKWKSGLLRKQVNVNGQSVEMTAEQANPKDRSLITFRWNNPEVTFSQLIEAAGILPIPPYLHRETEPGDLERYQTVYSKIKGSVAAPTAGLHFTEQVFNALDQKGHKRAELTLHVGAGTFQPVKSETISGHDMHTEHLIIGRDFVEQVLAHTGKLIAVGTTSVRTLESLYWLGVQILGNQIFDPVNLHVTQWEAYGEYDWEYTTRQAFEALLSFMDKYKQNFLTASTQIIIVPGYRFRVIDGMVTNFHQPQSTLLLLISAFLGNAWKTIYEHALANDYRFLSYGDSNLYLK